MSSSWIAVRDDGRMGRPGPRSGSPTSRKSFTSAQKLDHLAAYEAALANGQGGAHLRQHRLCSSLIGEWRRFREPARRSGQGQVLRRVRDDRHLLEVLAAIDAIPVVVDVMSSHGTDPRAAHRAFAAQRPSRRDPGWHLLRLYPRRPLGWCRALSAPVVRWLRPRPRRRARR